MRSQYTHFHFNYLGRQCGIMGKGVGWWDCVILQIVAVRAYPVQKYYRPILKDISWSIAGRRVHVVLMKFSVTAARSSRRLLTKTPLRSTSVALIKPRHLSVTAKMDEKFKPAKRVAGQKPDVWSIVNEAAAASPKQPIVNMGQGFFGYNPPKFILDAAKGALDRVECNQYSPTKGRPRLKKALADAYSPFFGRKLDPETEVTITTGANEGKHNPSTLPGRAGAEGLLVFH
jgi:hypothetical protein